MSSYILKLFYAVLVILLQAAGSIHGFNLTTQIGELKCMERERQALLKFKQGHLDDSGMLSTWRDNENNGDCCKWKGIGCNNETGHVQMLDLHGSGTDILIGAINISLLIELQNMEYLDLSFNYFLGSYIPEFIDSFSKLRYLNLSNSGLGGKIPFQLGKLTHLQYLDLSCGDNLEGAIPYQLGNLSQLKYLNLGGNHLVGEIPSELGNLAQLQFIHLGGNSLVGAIPYQLGNLAQLQYLNLGGNSLVGAIPFKVGDLPNLQSVRLGGNYNMKIKEQNHADAEWLSSLPSLTNLDLSLHNLGYSHHWMQMISKLLKNLRELRLSGCGLLDINIASLFDSHLNISTSLTILDLSSNMLASSTFMWLFNFSFGLQELYLSDNNLLLTSPSSLNFPSLVVLDLSYNKQPSSVFQGNFNFSSKLEKLYLQNCSLSDRSFLLPSVSDGKLFSSLVFIDLSYNLLTSSAIFHWLFNFTTNLHRLHLSSNLLECSIPEGFGNIMNSLEYIDLSGNKLQGEIPPSLRNISTLKRLHLFDNQITGMLPDLSTLSSLIDLRLSHNQLSGKIPKSIGLLSMLEYLILNGNSLEGEVTEAHFTNLSKLWRLDLSDNSLSLNFATTWVPPFQLSRLDLASCKLGPSFPSWLQTQSYLMNLNISNAGIVDSVPEWFWNITQNVYAMNISYNSLSGIIPNLPLKFTYFPILILTSNQFEGSVPPFVLKAATLHLSHNRFSHLDSLLCGKSTVDALGILDVSNNQLKGQLPDCWGHLKSLEYLDLSNNNLSGKIPLSMGALVNLKAFVLRNNSLIGELPSYMKNLINVTLLDVGENKLSGTIPSWIGESLQQLVILSLRVNHFSGSLPSQLCYLTQIKLLDLSKNLLSEQIPKCLHNFTAMAEMSINMSANTSHKFNNNFTASWYDFYVSLMWKGVEDVFRNPELLLKSIDLSSNNLTGEIPTAIGSLFGLVSLNLSRNCLSGEISSRLGNLKSLEFLDMSRNHFSGKIPSSLAQIDRLSVLDLSNNHLIGRIPTGTQLQSFNASSYEGNLDLCGKPLDKNCSEDGTPVPQVSLVFEHEDEESIFFEAFYMSLGVGFAVGFWGFIGPLLLYRSWRYSYIRFLNKIEGLLCCLCRAVLEI